MCARVGDGDPGRGNDVYKSRGMPGRIAVRALWLEDKMYGCMRAWWCGQLIRQHLLKRS